VARAVLVSIELYVRLYVPKFAEHIVGKDSVGLKMHAEALTVARGARTGGVVIVATLPKMPVLERAAGNRYFVCIVNQYAKEIEG
jgi:hypothetical protein